MWIASLASAFTHVERDTVGDLALKDGLVWVTRLQQGEGTGPTKHTLCRDDVSGGETEFPQLSFKMLPRTGMLLIWNNMGLDGRPNPYLLHSGNPVTQGTKYIVTKWFRRGFWV